MSGAVNKQTAAASRITLFFWCSHHALEDKRTDQRSGTWFLLTSSCLVLAARSPLTAAWHAMDAAMLNRKYVLQRWHVCEEWQWALADFCNVVGLLKPTIQPKNRVGLFTLQHYLLYLPVAKRTNVHLHT